ncbi:uncharacterized protein LOC117174820 [Belonocnema kinseyi]|uniref:uncharacterized protein LOC117174820 n=1 Tax=Belonocnema kinseyi TaxID=2817044 RepID=UPI00143DC9A8|nr:uncharacterized protein LOC117174820 [Belonocnema kinseyi]
MGDNILFSKNEILSTEHEMPPTKYEMPFASGEIFSQARDSKENKSMDFLEEKTVLTYVESIRGVLSLDIQITDQVLQDVQRLMGELADDISDDNSTVQGIKKKTTTT